MNSGKTIFSQIMDFLSSYEFRQCVELLEHEAEVFGKDRKSEEGPNVKDLHAKIGQLSMENDFLSAALRIDDASAKKG